MTKDILLMYRHDRGEEIFIVFPASMNISLHDYVYVCSYLGQTCLHVPGS